MNPKLLITLTALTLTAFATTARAGHRTFPELPTKQNELPTEQTGALKEPVKSVLNHYLKILSALANDSIDSVGSNASAIGSAIRGDSMKMLSPEMAAQADALAKAKDLASARTAIQATQQVADPLLGQSQNHERICGSLLLDGEGKLAAKGQENRQPVHERFDARLRND